MNRADDYILDSQNTDGPRKGLIAREDAKVIMYEHGVSTVMLSEVYGMVDDARRARIDSRWPWRCRPDAQHPDGHTKDDKSRGGWRYSPRRRMRIFPAPAGN